MSPLAEELLQTASASRSYLNRSSRRDIVQFVRSRWHSDGGFCGRDDQPDLYYTLFGILCLRALNASVPLIRLWRYLAQFGAGEKLDLVHLSCFIQLRSMYPMNSALGTQLLERLQSMPSRSEYDDFLKRMALHVDKEPPSIFFPDDIRHVPTSVWAARAMNLPERDEHVLEVLMARFCEGGGFRAGETVPPDLLSTATALFALRRMKARLNDIRTPCLFFVESLWRESGGFAGWLRDEMDDVEYTAYGLLAIGSLMR